MSWRIARSTPPVAGCQPEAALFCPWTVPAECTSGHPGPVAYSDPARAIGVAMRRAWARAWVVWGDTTERQPRTCEWDRATARYLAFNGRRSGAQLAPAVLTPHRRTNTDRGRSPPPPVSRDPRHIAPLNYRLAEASANFL